MKKLFLSLALILFTITPLCAQALGTSAKAAILINADTGEVIYEQNADEQLSMASTTKIMTSLLLCENGELEKEITVTAQMLKVEGSSMGLLAGDKVTYHDLLYGMLLASGNDAANVTAYALGGTVDGFVKMMNEKAAEIGLKNTSFETPSGLDSKNHYSTARDMAALARCALQNETFAKAAATQKATLCYGNPPYKRSLTNHNRLLKTFNGAIGVKTGFTKKSGRCLVSAAERDGKRVIAVTLSDPNDWSDHAALLEYGLSVIKVTQITPEQSCIEVPVINGTSDSLEIKISPFKVSSLDSNDLTCTVQLPKFVYAPVEKDEAVGNAVYKKGGTVIASVELRSEVSIPVSDKKQRFIEILVFNIKNIFYGIWEK